MAKLTVKQQKFVYEYIKTGNATQAAINAGYSKRTARSTGGRMLTNVDIKQKIHEQMGELHKSKIPSLQEII